MKISVYSISVCLALSLCLSFHATAQNESSSVPTLSLAQCRAIALDSSLTIENANLQYSKQEYDRKAMLTNFFPKFSGYALYLWTSRSLRYDVPMDKLLPPIIQPLIQDPAVLAQLAGMIQPLPLELDPANSYLAGVRVTQPIFMGGKIAAGYKMSRIGSEMASLNIQKSRAEVITSVDEAYWTYVKTDKLRAAANSFAQAVDSVYKTVQDAVDVGMATSNDLLKVKVQINNARLMCSKADNGSRLAMMNLCHSMGVPLDSELDVVTEGFDVSEEPFDDLSGEVENRPEYKLLDRNAELKAQAVKVARADFLPQLGAMASFSYANGMNFMGNNLLDNTGFAVVASLKVPIFQWGEGVYKVRSAKKQHEMALNEAQQMQELMKLEMTKNRLDLTDAKLQADMAATSIEDAEMNLRKAVNRYQTGMGTINDVLEAQSQRYKAEADHIEAIAQCRMAYTKYLKSVGRL